MLCLVCLHLAAWAEVVNGTIRDAETGEVLIGATVVAEEPPLNAKQGKQANQIGTATDAEGLYSLTLKAGRHVLTVRYLGYETLTKEVEVEVGGTTSLDFALTPSTNMLQMAVVTGEARHNTEAVVTKEQQEAHVTMTGVSEQQIKRTQDKNVGEVIRRVPGVSIIDEKFVMVRGLSQRYNNVWLNGAAVPSSEADQRAFSFDIVPSSQLDNLKIVKSAAPEYPADFSGGFIMVNTKDVPSTNTWSLGLGGGLNTATHFREQLRGRNGSKAFSGIATDWRTRTTTPLADLSLSGDVAHRWLTDGGHTLGLTGSANFTSGYQTLRDMENNMFGAYDVTHDRSNYLRRTTDDQYNHTTRLGAMLGFIWLPTAVHRLELKQIFNRLTKDRYTYRHGYDAQSDQRNSRSYKMLMNICFFIIDGMLLTTSDGGYRMATFSDEHMERLYEKFILEYYKRHHPELKPESRYLDWNLDEDKTANKALLPAMHSDIFLQHGERILIIDAKYYQHMTAENFGKPKVHTANLYQIHTYVSTTDIEHTGNVAGMLLYAKVEGEEEPCLDFTQKDGVRIMARTLNLALPFEGIREQLEEITQLLFTP